MLEAANRFWDEVAICGEPSESFETISEACAAADSVIVGRIKNAELGRTQQGDAEEDFYAETNITVSVDKTLRGDEQQTVEVSLILANTSPSTVDRTIQTFREILPDGQVLLLLRKRNDAPLYRLLGGDQGLWTRTTRGAIDNPIAAEACGGHHGAEVIANFLEGNDDLPKLIAFLD